MAGAISSPAVAFLNKAGRRPGTTFRWRDPVMSQGTRPVPAARPAILLLAAVAASLPLSLSRPCLGGPPPLPDDRLGVRTAPLFLLSRLDVRAAVALDENQTREAEKELNRLFGQAVALRGKSGPEIEAGRKAIDAAEEQWLKTWLNESQRKRLVQVDLQWEGFSALTSRPVIADHLALTAEQRDGLARAIAERDRRRKEGADHRTSESQLAQQALQILTPEQRGLWRNMLGDPFTPQIASTRASAPR
jgi:hypothetical protein